MWVCKSAFCHWFAFSIVISLSVLFSRTMCSPFNAVCLCTFSIHCHLSLCFVININFGAFHFQPLFRLRSTAKHAEQYLWWCDRRWRVNNAFDRLKSLCADPEKKVDWKFSEIKTPFTFMKRLVISICGWPLPLHTQQFEYMDTYYVTSRSKETHNFGGLVALRQTTNNNMRSYSLVRAHTHCVIYLQRDIGIRNPIHTHK